MIPILSKWIAKLSFFAKAGAICGALVGVLTLSLHTRYGPTTWGEALTAGVIFSLLGWLGLLLIFGIWLRYTIRQIWIQTLLVSLLTGLAVTALLQLWQTAFSGLVGFLIGILIGTLLDWLCRLLFSRPKPQLDIHQVEV